MIAHGKIAVSGHNGFIGTRLCEVLGEAGYEVMPMVRQKTDDEREIFYDYENRYIDSEKLSSCTAVIHLAGKNIMSGLWTKSLKHEIYESRVKSTRFIAHALANLSHGPKVMMHASAVGIYGDRLDQKLAEDDTHGHDFLAKLCIDWERGTLFAREAGIRVVNMRFGIVLDKKGGMLKRLLPWFKLGLGARLGTGEQYMSYITREGLCRAIRFVLENEKITGPVNMVELLPTTNKDFTEALAHVLKRKAPFVVPETFLRILGDQGDMILASIRAYPKVLLDHGFVFDEQPAIEDVLKKLLSGET